MAGLGTLARNLRQVVNPQRAYLYLTELDEFGSPRFMPGSSPIRRFQYYPESISDSKTVNYQTKEIPGASLPLYQWVNGGERTISFTTVFTSDTDHYLSNGVFGREADDSFVGAGLANRASQQLANLRSSGVTDYNVYIPAALAWLRRFMYPTYENPTGLGVPTTRAPRKLRLTMPGTYFSRAGMAGGQSDLGGVHCIMTQCDINYIAVFPSGNPRIVEVELEFAEVPQKGGRVFFPRVRNDVEDLAAEYKFGVEHKTGSSGSS